MNIHLPRLILAALASLSVTLTVWAQSATDPRFSSTSIAAYPPYISGGGGGPMMMLTASRDHTLFAPIYTDYEDIDGDGAVDYTFKPTFRYYGYFDPEKCYAYNKGEGRFKPAAMATASNNRLVCASGASQWAGNFLNWATMTRLDVVRKTLYGGRRVLDTDADTTLEMAVLAHDAHSFVKYYSGADIGDHTPFTASQLGNAGLTICSRGSSRDGLGYPVIRIAKGNYSLWGTTPGSVCNWSEEQNFSFGEKPKAFYQKYGPQGGGSQTDPTAHRTRLPSRADDGGVYGGIGPELAVRVQACAPEYVKQGSERCREYRRSSTSVTYKPYGLLQEFGNSEQVRQPVRAEFGLITGSYDDNFRGGQLRKNVGSFNDEVDLKTGRFCHSLTGGTTGTTCPSATSSTSPVGGIVQTFDKIRLYDAGGYDASGSGVSYALPREVVNGNFPSWGNPMSEMVTQALAYFAGLPMGGASAPNNGKDAAVGLPVGLTQADPLNDATVDRVAGVTRRDLYGRAICRPMHMLAISSGAVTHDTDDTGDSEDVYGTAAAFIGKNRSAAGQDAAATIQDATNQVGEREGINNTTRSVGSATGGYGVDCTAKQIGTVVTAGLAQVAGVCPEAPAVKGSYLGAGAAFIANTRAIRALGELTEATGRSVSTSRLPPEALRVRSYAATLSGGVARIEVPIPGKPGKFVYITPESSWDFDGFGGKQTNGDLMPGAMLTFRAIHGAADGRSASYVVTWNDAQFGGDYDMDIVGFLRWQIEPSPERDGAYKLTVLTDILNQEAGAAGGHGFSVIGTASDNLPSGFSQDGRYLTHGGMRFRAAGSECGQLDPNAADFQMRCSFSEGGMAQGTGGSDGFAWPTTYAGDRVDFYGSSAPRTTTVAKTFLVTDGAANVTLRDPLWYIAKYGSFSTGESKFALSTAALPDEPKGRAAVNWDGENNNGQACSAGACADGEPDGYFLARRPELLEKRLISLLNGITQGSNSAPATSTVQLVSGSLKYTAEFYNDGYGGTIKAYAVNPDGTFSNTVTWDASGLMAKAGNARTVITDDGRNGLVFDWASLNTEAGQPYRAALLGIGLSSPVTASEQNDLTAGATRLENLINYVRGGTDASYRTRKDGGVMGPIVNSTPWLQSNAIAGRYTDANFPGAPSYRAYVNAKAETPSVLWVGSNDGMLHGLNALSGTPILSYVPSPLAGRLDAALSANNAGAVALMDGSPATADVLVAPTSPGFGLATPAQHEWRTYLFSSLGRGGRAVFALDVSSPARLLNPLTATSAFKWVFSSNDDSDMGYQLLDHVRHPGSGQPAQVIYLNGGGFGLLVPNGHGSTDGRAALFILSVNGPASTGWQASSATSPGSYRKILVPDQSGGRNGLMGATWVDLDNNGTADVVYATDLRGNLWKFDIRSTNPAEWGSALVSTSTAEDGTRTNTGVPVALFSTQIGDQFLPITTAPVTFFPTFGGTMVSFGTGRAIDAADFPDASTTQRFITIWDKGRYLGDLINPPVSNAAGELTSVNDLPMINGTRVVRNADGTERTVDTFIRRVLRRDQDGNVFQVQTNERGEVVTGANGQEVPMTDLASAQQFKPAQHDGWYFDFPSAGEVVINSPVRRLNFLIFTTVRPKSASELEGSCSVAPQGALYAFSPVSGLPIPSLFTTEAMLMGLDVDDPKVTVAGDASGGSSYTTGGKTKTRALGNRQSTNLTSSASNLRIQWREITGMRTRATPAAPDDEESPPAGGQTP